MDRITYKIDNLSKDSLISKGFKYNRNLYEPSDEVYTYRFPLMFYNKIVVIECIINVFIETGLVNISVINSNTRELYAPFYDREYGEYYNIKIIDNKLNKKLKELGIKKI